MIGWLSASQLPALWAYCLGKMCPQTKKKQISVTQRTKKAQIMYEHDTFKLLTWGVWLHFRILTAVDRSAWWLTAAVGLFMVLLVRAWQVLSSLAPQSQKKLPTITNQTFNLLNPPDNLRFLRKYTVWRQKETFSSTISNKLVPGPNTYHI